MEDIQEKRSPLPTLPGKKVILRAVRLSDAEDFFAAASDPQVPRFLTWEPYSSVEQARSYIEVMLHHYETGEQWQWAICEKETDRFVGSIGLVPARTQSRGEIGYWLGKPYWCRGYMTEAMGLVIKFCFETLGFNRVQALHNPRNPASGRVMEKCGMTYEGTLRQYHMVKGVLGDSRMYSILREEYFKNLTHSDPRKTV